jgi:hypothetical protein
MSYLPEWEMFAHLPSLKVIYLQVIVVNLNDIYYMCVVYLCYIYVYIYIYRERERERRGREEKRNREREMR